MEICRLGVGSKLRQNRYIRYSYCYYIEREIGDYSVDGLEWVGLELELMGLTVLY